MSEDLDRAAARLATQNEHVITLEQLYMLGFTYDQVRTRVAHAVLHPIHEGVYAWGTPDLTRKARQRAALWSLPKRAFLSHSAAPGVYCLRPIRINPVELTLPDSGGRRRNDPRIDLHRTGDAIDRMEVRTWNGLRVSTIPRMLMELAQRESAWQLDDLITETVRKRLFSAEEVEAYLHRHARRPCTRLLKAAVRRYRPHPDNSSTLEQAIARAIAHDPEIPPPERNIYLNGWEIDFYWPQHNLTLEADGRDYHTAVKDLDKDRIKNNEMLLLGNRPMRITDVMWEYDPAGVLDSLKQLLGLEEPTPRSPRALSRLRA